MQEVRSQKSAAQEAAKSESRQLQKQVSELQDQLKEAHAATQVRLYVISCICTSFSHYLVRGFCHSSKAVIFV